MSADESARSRFQRLDALFQALKTAPAAEQRAAIDREAGTDAALAAQLEQLLRHHRALAQGGEDPLLRTGAALRRELGDSDWHAAEPGLPQVVGRFQIRGEIAQGGFGRVFRAEDPTLGREVAIKILRADRPGDRSLRQRLLEEGRFGGRLQHPAIVPVYEIGTTPTGEPYLAMKVVDGRDLATLLRERATPSHERARFVAIFEQVCQAIAYAHGRGIVHRDLKPQNIMIGAFGEVQVMDWGLAAEIAIEQGAVPAPVSGTPAYMAPEQARGEQVGGGVPADVFGLGAILCEILTGEPPYGQGSLTQTLARARAGDLSRARSLLVDCSTDRELAELAQQCLGAEPAQRPIRAADVASAVRTHLDSAAERVRRAELAASVAQARELSERRARRATAALAAVVVAVGIAGLASWYAIESAQRTRTDSEERRLTDALVEVERRVAAAGVSTARDLAAWNHALATADGMRALITASVRPQLAERAHGLWAHVEQRTTDLRFLAALDADLHDTTTENRWDRRPVAQSIRTAMAARLGAPIELLTVDGVAATLARIEPRDDLVNALDAWARVELEVDRNSPIGAQVHRVANAMDLDPWRRDLRAATAAGDLEQLRALADAPAAASAQPSSLRLLALALVRKADYGTGIRLLRRSAQRYPSHSDTLTDLAWLLLEQALYDPEEVRGYARTILALNPNCGSAYHMLAYLAAQKSDLDTAVELAERAVQCGPNDTGFRATLASLRLRCGEIATGLADLRWCIERSDPNHAVYPDLLQQLGAALTLAGHPEEAVDAYCKAIGHHRYRQDQASYFPDPELVPQLLEIARARLSGGTWQVELLVANLLDFIDDAPAALAAYERVTRASPAVMVRIQARILELRATLGQPAADLGAAARAIDAVSAGADYAAARARLTTAVAALRETGQIQLAEYSEGLLCEQHGLLSDALPHYRAALAADRSAVAVWQHLHACRAAVDGREAADAELRTLLAGGLPGPIVMLRPPPPRLELRTGAEADALTWAAHSPVDPRQRSDAVELRVWVAQRDDRDRRPALALVRSATAPAELVLEPGLLAANVAYTAAMRYVDAEQRPTSAWSPELAVPPRTDRATPLFLDLSAHFDVDVVADCGDSADDEFDATNGYRLAVDGCDGTRADVAQVQGLPVDGRLAWFQMGSYRDAQAVELVRTKLPIRIAVPRGRYVAVRLLSSAANGHARVPLALVYASGRTEPIQLYVSDWFNPQRPERFGSRWLGMPAVSGMDRIGRRTYEERNGATLFDNWLPVDDREDLSAILLTPDQAAASAPSVVPFLFAITVLRASR